MHNSIIAFFKRYESLILYTLLIILSYFALFQFLDRMVFQYWDEGQNSVNAFEMIHRGSWLVKYYCGEPDMWETKPPFFIWHVIVLMKLIGYNELAMRLPSALYTFGSLLVMMVFAQNFFRNRYIGFLASIIVLSSYGVVSRHYARTGDNDATLVFYILLSFVSYFRFLHDEKHKRKYFYLFIFALFFAFFTKSIVGFIFLPGMFIYTLLAGKLKYVLTCKDVYIGSSIFITLAVAYYWRHEILTPGYVKTVLEGEFGAGARPQDSFSWYYLQNFWADRFSRWIVLLPIAIVINLVFAGRKQQMFTLYGSLSIIISLFFLSRGPKNLWYDAPLYTVMALIIGSGAATAYTLLSRLPKRRILQPAFIVILSGHSLIAYSKIAKESFMPDYDSWHWEYYDQSYVMRDAIRSGQKLGNLKIIFDEYPSEILFYIKVANEQPGNTVELYNCEKLVPGDTVLCSKETMIAYVESHFETDVIHTRRMAKIYVLKSVKNTGAN